MMIRNSSAKVLACSKADGDGRCASTRRLGSFEYEPRSDGHKYLYVAVRACTADVPNLNMDMLPHDELKTAYRTFVGSYVYLNHDNTDPAKARGAIIDAKYHDEDLEDRWIEILMEMDEERCPKLCSLIRSGEIDTVSMGCSIESSTCSICGNVMEYPFEMCEHIAMKGSKFNGKLAYEICNGIEFFEESWVYDPADPTAQVQALEKGAAKKSASVKTAGRFSYTLDDSNESIEQGSDAYFDRGMEQWYPGDDPEIDGYAAGRILFDGREFMSVYVTAEDALEYRGDVSKGFIERFFDSQCDEVVEVFDQMIEDYDSMSSEDFAIEYGENAPIDAFTYVVENESGLSLESVSGGVIASKDGDEYDMDSFADAPRYPDEVDRQEDDRPCPLCGSDGFDGEICPTCGYQEPPEGFGDIALETSDDYEEFDDDEKGNDERRSSVQFFF